MHQPRPCSSHFSPGTCKPSDLPDLGRLIKTAFSFTMPDLTNCVNGLLAFLQLQNLNYSIWVLLNEERAGPHSVFVCLRERKKERKAWMECVCACVCSCGFSYHDHVCKSILRVILQALSDLFVETRSPISLDLIEQASLTSQGVP